VFDSLRSDTLRAARDVARLPYGNHRAPGLDPLAMKLDTLAVDICVELGSRGDRSRWPTSRPRPADARARHPPRARCTGTDPTAGAS
jgi:hypothetical protein